MTAEPVPQLEPRPEDLVDLIVRCHSEGYFVRDPSPGVVRVGETGFEIPKNQLEKRTYTNVPHLSLDQLWSLMHGQSTRRKLDAGHEYAVRREIDNLDIDLEDALKLFTARQLERCIHDNRDFKVIQAGDLVWYCRRNLLRDSHRVILEDPDRFLEPGPKQMKDGKSTTLSITPGDAVIKRFNLKKYRSLLKHQFARTRARRAFQTAYHLETLGIATPPGIAFAERRVLGTKPTSYLISLFMPDVLEVDQAFRQWTDSNDTARRDRALESVGRLVGLLHDAGFANRDLKARNILVSDQGEASIIDLDGITHSDKVNDETRIKNLRRMVRDIPAFGTLTVRDRVRFLRSYSRTCRWKRSTEIFRRLAEEPWQ